MKPYPKYKGSGVEWIGKIPEGWNSIKLKRISQNHDGKRVPLSSDQRGEMSGNIPYYGACGIIDHVNKYLFEGEFLLVGEDGAPFFIPNKDVAFIASGRFWVNNHAHILSITMGSLKFVCYAMNRVDYKGYITGSTRDKLTQGDLMEIIIPQPSLAEQQQIASFLDTKTSLIDEAIEKKERLIELLEEERTAKINHAVTRGLNPKIELKESGVEWLGKIPKHWIVKKLSWCFRMIGSGTTPKSDDMTYYEDGDVPWVNTGDLNDSILHQSSKNITKKALKDYSTLKIYPAGTLLIALYGATIGKLAMINFPATTNQACCAMADSDVLNSVYSFYFLSSQKERIISLAVGGGQPNISQELIRNFRISVPPLPEQQQIVDYLNQETTKIEQTINRIQKEIELLQEYRTALISEAVTGKIDVRGLA